ncbi:MAG TPA: hypothetical protein VMY40_14905 [Anaerolineae bacterium]|nr:hypothetical protein [Anaerolineae bacterium]
MHRSELAGKAEQYLRQDPLGCDAVLWLDGDMVSSPNWVRELYELVALVAKARPAPFGDHPDAAAAQSWTAEQVQAWKRENAPALCGAYVKRNLPTHMALRRVFPSVPDLEVEVQRETGRFEKYSLPAVVSGMGCMMQTREAFLVHCSEAPRIEQGAAPDFPAICASGPGQSADGSVCWASEDWMYTSWEWQRGRGVYLVRHALFGHVCPVVRYPTADTILEDGDT